MANKPNDGGSTPGTVDTANAATAPDNQTTQAGEVTQAEGARIKEETAKEREKSGSDVVTLADATPWEDDTLKYDDAGVLVNKDGKRVALASDALDPDVGWTVQQAGTHIKEKERVAYPGTPSGVPDQTVHPDELPDPVAALRAGLLPQNAAVLNVDPNKFSGKKPLEP
jgi:hypothetical protein